MNFIKTLALLACCVNGMQMYGENVNAKMRTFDNPKPYDYILFEDTEGEEYVTNMLNYGIRGTRAIHRSYSFTHPDNREYMYGVPTELGAAPHLKFSYRFACENTIYEETGSAVSADTPLMIVDISEDGKTWVPIYRLGPDEENKYTSTLGYSDIDIDLKQYANKNCRIRLSFGLAPDKAAQDQRWGVSIDNFMLGTQYDYDIGVAALMGPSSILYDEEYYYTVVVENIGKNNVGKYQVAVIDNEGEEVNAITDVNLPPNASKTYKISWSAWKSGNYSLTAKVTILDNEDGDISDNVSAPLHITARSTNKIHQHVISSKDADDIKSSPTLPVNFNATCSSGGSLYYANEIGVNRGTISAIIYKVAGGEYLSENFKVYISETSKTYLNEREAFNPDEMTLVFDGRVHLPNGEYEMAIPFIEPYKYKGGNLIIYTEHYGHEFVFGRYGMVSTLYDDTRRSVTRSSKFEALAPEELRSKKPQGDGMMYTNITLNMTDSPTGTVTGYVSDASGAHLAGVDITIDGESMTTVTRADGSYSLSGLAEGKYKLIFSLDGYNAFTTEVDVYPNEATLEDVTLQAIGEVTVSGKVTDMSGMPIEGAEVVFEGVFSDSSITAADGSYSVNLTGRYDYDIKVYSPHYAPVYASMSLALNSEIKDFRLTPLANAPHSAAAQLSENGSDVNLNWTAPTVQLRHENGEWADGIGFNEGYPNMIFGSAYREHAVVKEISWYNGEGHHGNFNVYVFGLSNGKPDASKLLYRAENVHFVDNAWNSHILTAPVEAQGFMLAIGCDGYLNLGLARVSESYPFLEGNEYYAGDSYTDHISDMSNFTSNYHLMLRAGVELKDGVKRTAPNHSHYNVYRIKEGDSEWVNIGKSSSNEFSDNLLALEQGTYRWAITSDYGNHESEKAQTLPLNYAGSGIENISADSEVYYDAATTTLSVTGEGTHIKLYNIEGICVADVYGQSLNTGTLPDGLYVATIILSDQRIIIKKLRK